MDERTRKDLELIFTNHCFMISELGEAHTIFFIIKNNEIVPVFLEEGSAMPVDKYISFSLNTAHEKDADAVILLGEQYMVKGKKDDAIMKQLLSGEMKASDHPDRKPFLVLSYMTAEGVTDLLFGEIKTSISGTKYVVDQKWTFNATTSVLVPWRRNYKMC